MTTQPAALRLAAELDKTLDFQNRAWAAASELRRLHEVNQELLQALHLTNIDCQHLHHAHKDRHTIFDVCPVVARITDAITKAT
jgi:hypothetical protein